MGGREAKEATKVAEDLKAGVMVVARVAAARVAESVRKSHSLSLGSWVVDPVEASRHHRRQHLRR